MVTVDPHMCVVRMGPEGDLEDRRAHCSASPEYLTLGGTLHHYLSSS